MASGRLQDSATVSPLYVQYGSGFSAPENWRNFDASPTLRFERVPVFGRLYTRNDQRFPPNVEYGDVVKGLPVASDSCAGVFASHVLEHLSLKDFHKALEETRRILRSGGMFRLVVPDLYHLCRRYVERYETGVPNANDAFMRDSYLGQTSRPRGPLGLLKACLGNSAHLWMWDEPSLSSALEEHGFGSVRRAEFGDCRDPAFRAVEHAERFKGACAMEAAKP